MHRNKYFHDLLTTIGDRGRHLLSPGGARNLDAAGLAKKAEAEQT